MKDVSVSSIALSAYADTALRKAVSAMRPGWVVLRGCTLGRDGTCPSARVQYALLHAKVGIAFLDVVPGTTTTNAVERLGRRLDAAGFQAEFQRNPPMRYFCVPLRAVPDIGRLLDQEFGQQSSSTLPCGDAWVATAQRLLMAEPLRNPLQLTPGDEANDQPRQHHARIWQHPAEGHPLVWLLSGVQWLGVFWGLVAMSVGGGGLLLQYLGPPEGRASSIGAIYPGLAPGAEVLPRAVHPLKKVGSITGLVTSLATKTEVNSTAIDIARLSYAAADAQNFADVDPQRAIAENEQAIVELQRRLKRFEPKIDASLGTNSATPEASPGRVLPDSTDTLTGTAKNLSAPVTPFEVAKANVVSYATTMSTAQAAQDSLTGVSAPPQADVQVPSHSGDGLVLPEISLASTETILADAAASPDASADKLQNAPEAATASLTVVLPVLPKAKKGSSLVQDLLPPDFDASASTAESASTAQTYILMKAAPSRDPENTPLLSPSAAILADIMVRRADALLQHGDISAARLLYERAAAAGSGHAATAMGKTFDATFLAGVGVIGMGADPTLAATWYRRALELGDAEARTRLQVPAPAANRISTAFESHP